jgi:hypothetical protein
VVGWSLLRQGGIRPRPLFIADTGNNRTRKVTSGATVVTVSDPWVVLATGAFFGPGTTGLAWQNQSTGLVAFWNESGGVRTGITFSSAPDPTVWKLLGTGDFNGDGTTDLLWQNQNPSDPQYGLVAMWLMDKNKLGITSSMTFPDAAPSSVWRLLGVGDFDGNGTIDLAWQDQNSSDSSYGLVATWLMNTSGGLSSVAFPGTATPATWKLLGIGDFDQDGTADLVWQDVNTSDSSYGLVGFWLLSDGNFSQATFPAAISPSNMQLTIANVVGDAPPDLIWHNLATGQVIDWQIQQNATVVSSSVLGAA